MSTQHESTDAEDFVEQVEQEEGEDTAERPGFTNWAMNQTPWWGVSVAMHVLVILLLGLISMAISFPHEPDEIAVVKIQKRPEINLEQVPPEPNTPNELDRTIAPTDPTAPPIDVLVPKDILDRAELSDHFETVNLEVENRNSAKGVPDSHLFQPSDSDSPPGGGGVGGISPEDLLGVGGPGSPGKDGGLFGGDGGGIGPDHGPGNGPHGQRGGGGRVLRVMRGGGGRNTEKGVELALKWLALHQEPDGHWDAKKYQSNEKTDTAVTGFALLAFLGAGHTEKVGMYKDNVRRAVAWLKSKQGADGLVFDQSDAGGHRGVGYPHAITGMALAEAAGMARVPDTVAAAQKAIDYTMKIHQQNGNDAYNKGAWRYRPNEAPDTSVTGWFVMQLKSGKVSGLSVEQSSFDGAMKYLDKVEHPVEGAQDTGYGKPSVYWYQPERNNTTPRLCAIGNLCRQFMGGKKEDLESSVRYFVEQGGVPGAKNVDLYYWYYGSLCCFQQGGDTWKKWNEGMKSTLLDSQRKGGDENGSWDPTGDYSTEWGRVGQTALSCLCLEVYYRYLPIFNSVK